MELTVVQPSRVTIMIKPVGALCNLDCTYCYYLPTKTIYDDREHRMSLQTLEDIFAGILPNFADEVTIAWQGGEPTLAGFDFFKKAIEFQTRHARAGQRVRHALQTNGTLLDDDWCRFLRTHDFLIGLSVDGPPRFHDHYRITNRQAPSSDMVLRGLKLLQKHAVEYNILCVLNDHNVHHPEEILHYLLNLGTRWVQFIPAIEWEPAASVPTNGRRNVLAPYSPDPEAYGRFLCRLFDMWFERYRKRVSVRIFDAVLNKLVLGEMPFCILDGSCHNQLTIEHDGAVFGCDHFIERRWQLSRIGDHNWESPINLDGTENVGLTIHGDGYRKNATLPGRDIEGAADLTERYAGADRADRESDETWFARVDSQRLATFARRKQHLPEKCRQCRWKPYCHGGCPKHRPNGGEVPEPTILCEAYIRFYEHAMPRLEWLAGFLRRGEQPPDPEPVETRAAQDAKMGGNRRSWPAGTRATAASTRPPTKRGKVSRNEPCPCGSGLKYKLCHGRQ